MRAKRNVQRWAWVLGVGLCLVGCAASPDVVVRQPAGSGASSAVGAAASATANATAPGVTPVSGVSVSLQVQDLRPATKTRPSAREVIARGDKGRVYLETPATDWLRQSLTESLRSQGIEVREGSDVVIEAQLRTLDLQATQFTHWGLPSERASTLDALGAVVPGPVRPTTARAAVSLVLRKRDQKLGLSYYADQTATGESREREVVAQVIGQCLREASVAAIGQLRSDVQAVAALPVTSEEFAASQLQLRAQQSQVDSLRTELEQRRATLEADRTELENLRKKLEAEQAAAAAKRREAEQLRSQALLDSQRVAAELAKLTSQRDSLEKDQLQHKQQIEQLTALQEQTQAQLRQLQGLKEQSDQQKAQQAQLLEQQQQLSTQREQLDRKQADVTALRERLASELAALQTRKNELTQQQQAVQQGTQSLAGREAEYQQLRSNLEQQAKDLLNREAAAVRIRAEYLKRHAELAQKESALKQWSETIQAKQAEIKPPQELLRQVPPMIAVIDPQPADCEVSTPRLTIRAVAVDDRAVRDVRLLLNGAEVPEATSGSLAMANGARAVRIEMQKAEPSQPGSAALRRIERVIDLTAGVNRIVIQATDDQGQRSEQAFTVTYKPSQGRVFLVAIGIDKYRSVPALKYAVSDARLMTQTLAKGLGVKPEDTFTLLDEAATLPEIKHLLGVRLRAQASRQDTVVIYFSGHGAPEEDPQSPDHDGIEKYLLPVEANMESFYSTALPMKDVTEIFRRLPCERVVFIADTCYSGAAGGRTLAAAGKQFRAVKVERALDRLGGKGRIILAASRSGEISQERDDLGHGVFTYHLTQGLQGKADSNRDGAVTVSEIYEYVSREVPKATGNAQNPLMQRDEAVGDIVLSIVR